MKKQRKPAPPRSPYAQLVQQRQTEIPKLVSALLATAKAGDREAQQAVQMLNAAAMNATLELTAGMNVEAILHLLALLRETLADFEEQWRSQPRFYQIWAGINDAWPCLLPRRTAEREALMKFVGDKLRLGMDYPLNLSGKSFDPDAVGTKVALYLYQLLDGWHLIPKSEQRDRLGKIRTGLPPLSRQPSAVSQPGKIKSVAQEWWEAAEPLFLELYGEDFENHRDFRGFKGHASFKGLKGTRGQIRSTIKASIAQGFFSIAPKAS